MQTEDKIKTVWTFRATFRYHCKVSMVFKGTITIEWNGLGEPLGSMVLRWLSTIGATVAIAACIIMIMMIVVPMCVLGGSGKATLYRDQIMIDLGPQWGKVTIL